MQDKQEAEEVEEAKEVEEKSSDEWRVASDEHSRFDDRVLKATFSAEESVIAEL